MNLWLAACCALLALLFPVVWLGSRGDEVRRLVALQMFAPTVVLLGVGFSHYMRQPSYLVVPLALAVLGVTGTLVFTRLLAPTPRERK